MQQIYALIIGIAVLVLGIPIGNLLAKSTKDEAKKGKKWFKLVIILSSIGAIIFLILGNDALLFGFLFMAIVTSRSIKRWMKS
jgi:F0F1-type ATP synthase membrane subunit c/vacuolar-type H+-ATPase subunit K